METTQDFDAVFAEALKKVQTARKSRLADIPDRAMVWMSLTPAWTPALAEACNFPTQHTTTEFFQRIAGEGFCHSGAVKRPTSDREDGEAEEQSFWLKSDTRAEVLQNAIRDSGRGLSYLQQEMSAIGAGILRAQTRSVPVPEAISRWAELAAQAQYPYNVAELLGAKVEDSLSRNEPGELLRWIEAARPIEELLKGALSTTIARASRRLELFHRHNDDLRRLATFLERGEQIRAFLQMVKAEGGAWALHYVGSGGMGKTMLIRYLSSRLIPDLKASTARIDFDYLNPNYPARAPGLLLVQLALELKLHDQTGAASRYFGSVIEKMESMHESLNASHQGAPPLEAGVAQVFDVLPLFVDALRALPQPVVVILDTCEELAKIRPEAALAGEAAAETEPRIPPSVKVTFDLFERLHEMHDNLRVVFSGRRPLASAGEGWRCPSSPLAPRPYLRACPIRGFTEDEAEEYLREKCHPATDQEPGGLRGVTEDFIEPIKLHCLMQGQAERFEWDDPAVQIDRQKRYHPFDLSLYATWVREDKELIPETLKAAGIDRYVEIRIVGRINDPALRALLPAVTLMGRFDAGLLRAVSRLDESEFKRIFQELSNQEWINRQSSQFLEVEPGLRKRLLSYFQTAMPDELEAARRMLATHLEDITTKERLDRLDLSYFSAALRVLAPEPRRSAQWWRNVEARFTAEQAYDWARRVCELITGDEDGDAESAGLSAETSERPDGRLRAAVRATYAASLLHTEAYDKLADTWAGVELFSAGHPLREAIPELRLRALAGQITATRYTHQPPDESRIRDLWRSMADFKAEEANEQIVVAVIAAVEAILEFSETDGRYLPLLKPGPLAQLAKSLKNSDQALYAFSCALAGRLQALRRRPDVALEWFRKAVNAGRSLAKQPDGDIVAERMTEQQWLDWLAPDQIGARVRLEFVRGSYPAAINSVDALTELGEKAPVNSSIDTDRLHSAIRSLIQAGKTSAGLTPETEFLRSRSEIRQQPLCRAHEAFPPLFVRAAEELAMTGEVDRATGILQQQSVSFEHSGSDLDAVLEADRAFFRIIRRMRLRDENLGSASSLDQSALPADRALLQIVNGLSRPETRESLSYGAGAGGGDADLVWSHERFRTICALPKDMAVALIEWANRTLPPKKTSKSATFAATSCYLDRCEAAQIAAESNLANLLEHSFRYNLREVQEWHQYWRRPAEALTLLLRMKAIFGKHALGSGWQDDLVERIGMRRAAMIALEEGELLALRLPAQAIWLLDRAYDWFIESGDAVSAFIAKTAAALALARLQDRARLKIALAQIRRAFDRFRGNSRGDGSGPILSVTWRQLESVANHPRRKLQELNAPTGWRPWLIRLIACLAWKSDHDRPRSESAGSRTFQLIQWVEANYGEKIDGVVRVPPELAEWPTSHTPQRERKSAAKAKPHAQTNRLVIQLNPPQPVWRPLSSSTPPYTAQVIMRWGEEGSAIFSGLISGLLPYSQMAADLLRTGLAVTDRLIPQLTEYQENKGEVEMVMDQYASWIAWEAILTQAQQELLPEAPACRFRRTLTERKRRSLRPWQKDIASLVWASEFAHENMAQLVWNDLGRVSIVNNDMSLSRTQPPLEDTGIKAQILHIIGPPQETSSGIRLDMAGQKSARQLSKTSGRGNLIRADMITSQFPELKLCILQAPPDDEITTRSSSDRINSAFLRLLGAELFNLGVPAVITIPSLPMNVSEKLLSAFAHSLINHFRQGLTPPVSTPLRPGPRELLDSMYEAQQIIQSWNHIDPQVSMEMSQDLCLYADDERYWNL